MSDNDHKELAEGRLLHWNSLDREREDWQQTNATEALVHATLYAADQHLAANLIAWTTRPGYKPSAEERARIEKALGLA